MKNLCKFTVKSPAASYVPLPRFLLLDEELNIDTTIALGRLLLQNYWIMDGAPTVSYEWFARVE